MLLSSMQRQGNRLILNVSKSPGDNNLFFKYNISKGQKMITLLNDRK